MRFVFTIEEPMSFKMKKNIYTTKEINDLKKGGIKPGDMKLVFSGILPDRSITGKSAPVTDEEEI